MKAGLFIATALLYAVACILYLFLLTRGSERTQRLPGTVFVAALGRTSPSCCWRTRHPGSFRWLTSHRS